MHRGIMSLRLQEAFTLHSLADLFIPTSTLLLREAFSDARITARRLCVHISTRYSVKQLIELWQYGVNEIAKVSKRQQENSNSGSRRTTTPPTHIMQTKF